MKDDSCNYTLREPWPQIWSRNIIFLEDLFAALASTSFCGWHQIIISSRDRNKAISILYLQIFFCRTISIISMAPPSTANKASSTDDVLREVGVDEAGMENQQLQRSTEDTVGHFLLPLPNPQQECSKRSPTSCHRQDLLDIIHEVLEILNAL